MNNKKMITLKLERIDVCDLLLATTAIAEAAEGAEKWNKLHDKLLAILDEFDEKNA